MLPRTPSQSLALALLAAAGLALVAPAPVRAAVSGYSGRYEVSEVVEGDQVVSMTFAVLVVSHRSEEISGATVRLLDASDPGVVYAQFPVLRFSQGVDVLLMATVSLQRSEWDRWRSGAPPRMRLEASDADGTDLSAMVEMVQVSSPEVLQ